MNGAGCAEITPTVAPRRGGGCTVAPCAQRLMDDAAQAHPFEHDHCAEGAARVAGRVCATVCPVGLRGQPVHDAAHAAQIAHALLHRIGDQPDVHRRRGKLRQGLGQSEQAGNAGRIVADAGAADQSFVQTAQAQVGFRREDGICMGGHEQGGAVLWARAADPAIDIAQLVPLDVSEADGAHAILDPRGPLSLGAGGGGDLLDGDAEVDKLLEPAGIGRACGLHCASV